MLWVELRTLLTIFIMLLVPGWAILSVTDLWRRFEAIERWILSAGLSIAFYPFDERQFNISAIQQVEGVQTIYQDGGVSIYKLCD